MIKLEKIGCGEIAQEFGRQLLEREEPKIARNRTN